MNAVVARDLSAGYATGAPVVSDCTFSVAAGSSVAVLGPNGGGKTTLLRALLGDVPQRTGEVELAGKAAYVPQTERYRLDYPVSALDVVLMGTFASAPRLRPLGRVRHDRARAALERVGLGDRSGARFGSLSGGQRQRVVIARALVQDAEILLLDEPMSGVDHPSGERILGILDDLRAEGRAILVSTHDIAQARRFDSVLCVNHRQVFHGPPSALTPAVLADTYGGEMVVLDDGAHAVVVPHREHD